MILIIVYGIAVLGASHTRSVLDALAMFFTPTSRIPPKNTFEKSKYISKKYPIRKMLKP